MRENSIDFVWLSREVGLISNDQLIATHEKTDKGAPTTPSNLCEGERLIPGTGLLTKELKKSRNFKEEREYVVKEKRLARFYFLTKCWSEHLKEFLLRVKKEDGDPDLILILSCLWDTNR